MLCVSTYSLQSKHLQPITTGMFAWERTRLLPALQTEPFSADCRLPFLADWSSCLDRWHSSTLGFFAEFECERIVAWLAELTCWLEDELAAQCGTFRCVHAVVVRELAVSVKRQVRGASR
jgi:hypothetical protein